MGKKIRFPVIPPPDWGEIIEMVQKALQEEERPIIVIGAPTAEKRFVLISAPPGIEPHLTPSQEDVLTAVRRNLLPKLPPIRIPEGLSN